MPESQLPLFPGADGAAVPPSPCGLVPGGESPAGLSTGACSFTHESWSGSFYPASLPGPARLGYYARFFDAVEVDATFYRVPSASTVDRWLASVPPRFAFGLKAPRSLTHDALLSLDDPLARRDWEALLALLSRFGEGRVSLLLQLGPGTGPEKAARLDRVLSTLPPGALCAVELRHAGWSTPATDELLGSRGAVRALTDLALPELPDPSGVPFAYVRLLGDLSTKYDPRTGRIVHRYDRVLWPKDEALARWAGRIARLLSSGARVHAFVNNHFEGFSPATIARLRSLAAAAGADPRLSPSPGTRP